MYIPDIKRVIEQVSRDKGIDSDVLVKALEEALKSAAKKRFGSKIDIEVKYNDEAGEIEVFQFKEVVEEITEPETQISVEEGCKLDPECEIGDSLGTKMDTNTFGRIAAQSAKQVIIQKMKDAERDAVYAGFIDRKGEIINGIVQRIERGNLIVNLGQTEGILPEREQVPKESYRRGDRVRAYIIDVRHETRGPQIILSRTHPNFLINLFKTEVPEISEGIVHIMGAAREPGIRAKFAVASNDSDIDPVGACVGMKGSRVQNVVQELRGEKIDIISWHVDPAKFVCNALAPAEISRVIIDEENRSMEVIVPDEFLSVAIGKGGQNVRLASKLTRWRLDVKNETRYSKDMQDGYDSLMALPEMSISLADALYEKGFFSAEELAKGSVEDVIQVRGLTEEEAIALVNIAKRYLSHPGEITAASEASLSDDSDDDAPADSQDDETGQGESDEPANSDDDAPADSQDDETGQGESDGPANSDDDAPADSQDDETEQGESDGPANSDDDAPADSQDDETGHEGSDAPADPDGGTGLSDHSDDDVSEGSQDDEVEQEGSDGLPDSGEVSVPNIQELSSTSIGEDNFQKDRNLDNGEDILNLGI